MSATETHITVDAQTPNGGDSNNSDAAAAASAVGAPIRMTPPPQEPLRVADDANPSSSSSAAVDQEIYRAAVVGDVALFRRRPEDFDNFRSSRGNTVLHLAARSGCDELVRAILGQPGLAGLLFCLNSSQNTPLHEAVIAGNLSTVTVLVSWARENPRSSADQNEEIAAVDFLLGFGNKDRNSALHLALSESYRENESIARFLFEQNSEVTHFGNKEEKSPLYMAAAKGYVNLFEVMMQKPIPSEWSSSDQRLYRIRIAHAAISAKSIGILNILLRDWSEAFTTEDYNDMMPPIHLAVHLNYFEGVRSILNHFSECSYYIFQDRFPIHVAASNGQVEIVQEFLRQCPDLRELYNHSNQNILHLAAQNGKANVVSYILKNPELEMLINEKDEPGDSPLHLAAKGGHADVVIIMTRDSRVDLGLLNADAKTALEVAEHGEGHPSFLKRLTRQALTNVGAPRASMYERIISDQRTHGLQQSGQTEEPNSIRAEKEGMEFCKDRSNTLMLVSTLITTITFAAGLISPGSSSDDKDFKPNLGMFYVFYFANAISMYSSITVIVILIWGKLADLQLHVASLKFVVPVLLFSLLMVCISFMAGAYLTACSTSVTLSKSIAVLGLIAIMAIFTHSYPRLILWFFKFHRGLGHQERRHC